MICLITAYLLNVLDYFITAHWVRKFGLDIELNPLGRWLFENNVAWVVKILLMGGLFALLGYCITRRPKHAWVAYIPLTAYAVIVAYHLCIVIGIYN